MVPGEEYRYAPLTDDPDAYCFRFLGPTAQTIINNERTPFRRNQVVQVCAAMYVRPLIELIPIDNILSQISTAEALGDSSTPNSTGGGGGVGQSVTACAATAKNGMNKKARTPVVGDAAILVI